MSDLSDVDDLFFDRADDCDSCSDVDVEQLSSDDEDPKVIGMRAIKKARAQLEKERRDHLSKLFIFLQEVILDGDQRKETWKRINTVTNALQAIKDLKIDESTLEVELEILMQQNFILKVRLARLERKLKLNNGSYALSRKVSGQSQSPPTPYLSEKHRVFTENKQIKDSNPTVVTLPQVVKNVENKNNLVIRNLGKKSKIRTGLSEEEKELNMMQEQIKSLLYEANKLWDEVKDEEEIDSDDIDLHVTNQDVKSVTQNINLDESKKKSVEKKGTPKFISVTDISKLMDPQFLKDSNPDSSGKTPVKRASNSLSEENKVVKEKNTPPGNICTPDLIEALQAVDNLCREIIPDLEEPSTPEATKTNPQCNKPTRVTRRSKKLPEV